MASLFVLGCYANQALCQKKPEEKITRGWGTGIAPFVYSRITLDSVSMWLFFLGLLIQGLVFVGCSWSLGLRNTGEGLATRMESTKGKRGSKEYQDCPTRLRVARSIWYLDCIPIVIGGNRLGGLGNILLGYYGEGTHWFRKCWLARSLARSETP